MAGTAESVIAARAALLLRCQAAREERRRIVVAQATRAHAVAADALAGAQARLTGFEARRQDAMRQAYDALAGRQVDAATLHALPALEARRRNEAATLAVAIDAAAARQRETAAALAEGMAALALAARATQRRERLADMTARRQRVVLASAEEIEREDAATDSWRSAA